MWRIVPILLVVLFLPLQSLAAELNAGFVQGLWYGTKTIVAGEPTRIYVALRNNTEHDLTGTVRFTDNGNRIGVSYVSALPGRLVEAWVDWTPTYGTHTIVASLGDVYVREIGAPPLAKTVDAGLASSTLFVDRDTDKDGIPNLRDTDDDNDTVPDDTERDRGTDPLTPNPIPTATPDEEDAVDPTPNETSSSNPASAVLPNANTATALLASGLETFIPNKTARDAVTQVTNLILDGHEALNEYRSERADLLKEAFVSVPASTTVDAGTDTATITRTQTRTDRSFIELVIESGRALISGLYTFVLWIAANVLAHPALVELAILLTIVYVIYRIARRFGRRRFP